MDRQKLEAEEILYREYSGKLRQIEEKRDDIEKEIRQAVLRNAGGVRRSGSGTVS